MKLIDLHYPLYHLALTPSGEEIRIEWRVYRKDVRSSHQPGNLWLVVYTAMAQVDRHDLFAVGKRMNVHVGPPQLEVSLCPDFVCFVGGHKVPILEQ